MLSIIVHPRFLKTYNLEIEYIKVSYLGIATEIEAVK
jgi:hypothetical protein